MTTADPPKRRHQPSKADKKAAGGVAVSDENLDSDRRGRSGRRGGRVMSSAPPVLMIMACILIAIIAAWVGKPESDDTSLQLEIIEWVRSSGGYFHRNQEFRRAVPGDPSSYFGIFATEDIQEGELLTSVPWKCMIADDSEEDGELFCSAYRRLNKEMRMGDESFFAPYIRYLLKQPRGKLPSDWSKAAKNLLKEVIGHDALPPTNLVGLLDSWKTQCQGGDDPLEQQAFLEHHLRADDNVLIPLYDLYNHNNGIGNNGKVVVSHGKKQDFFASRAIQKGEQIGFSYDLSPHMGSSNLNWNFKHYGTPEFLRDYGFVEHLPQRWHFPNEETGFILTEDEAGNTDLEWITGEPTPSSRSFFLQQLERLQTTVLPHLERIEKEVNGSSHQSTTSKSLPQPNELAIIRQYFNALQFAISAAVQNTNGRPAK